MTDYPLDYPFHDRSFATDTGETALSRPGPRPRDPRVVRAQKYVQYCNLKYC